MEIIVGRKGDQPFPIADKGVSGRHIKLTPTDDGHVLVEDLGSTNGTFVDNVRITRKVVSRHTSLRLGPTYELRVADVLPAPVAPPTAPSSAAPPKPEVQANIQHLEGVWNEYQSEKIRIQKSNASKGFLRMMPMLLLAGLGYLISCIPELADFRVLITFAGLALGALITWISYQSTVSLPAQMDKLDEHFKLNYTCPQCNQFLGYTPFEGLRTRGQCAYCKTKWTPS